MNGNDVGSDVADSEYCAKSNGYLDSWYSGGIAASRSAGGEIGIF
jgi:hypothetical protein